jgi:ATP-dependent helicase/nuclease subunit B
LNIVFGTACDGRTYPDFPGDDDGTIGSIVVGPSGLIGLLETQLGLTGPWDSDTVRVAAYANKLQSLADSGSEHFFKRSLQTDPWGTAEALLAWRDDLVAAGWTGERTGQKRLDDLSDVESALPALPFGIYDRLRVVLETLKRRPKLSITSLKLVEPRELLPPPWRRLIDAIGTSGPQIIPPTGAALAPAESDVRAAQIFLAGGESRALTGDGTLNFIEADTELLAAEALADWLAAGPEQELSNTVVIDPSGDTALLDQALRARGLPALGQSASSAWRGVLQVLPLAFAAAWAPFNTRALLDLLLLPRPPIGRAAARKLARALVNEPGTGASAWQKAWVEIEDDLAARYADHPERDLQIRRRLELWKQWTSVTPHERSTGMPAETARKIASRVGHWAAETDAGRGDALFLTLARAANDLATAISQLGQETLSPLLLERILERVLAAGAQNPDHIAIAGGLRVVKHPAAVWGSAARVIWWNFVGPGERVPVSPWSLAEKSALENAGCQLETAAQSAARISWSYTNGLSMASNRVLLFRPALVGGEQTISHPLAHQLDPLTRPAGSRVTWKAEQLLEGPTHQLAGRELQREAVLPVPPPQAQAHWILPTSVKERLDGRRESATSFERLVDCHLRWVVQDVIRLNRGSFSAIPGSEQLLGNLTHEIASRVMPPGPIQAGEDILEAIDKSFSEILPAIAAPLEQPEYAGELASARAAIPKSLAHLAKTLRDNGFEIVGTELERTAEFDDGLSVLGHLDLLVIHPTLGLSVIDLKWTRSPRRRHEEIADGRALQLATYGAIVDPDPTVHVTGAYYLLKQRRMLGTQGAIVPGESISSAKSLADTWNDLKQTWAAWRNVGSNGLAVATGIDGAAARVPSNLSLAPGKEPCRYCELSALCRTTAQEATR